ncbi:MAG: amidohydrolase family protein [Phycisphaerales bacterium]
MLPRAARPALTACLACALAALACIDARAQEAPPPGMRPGETRRDALVDVVLVPRPGQRVDHATVVLKDGWIEAAGPMDAVVVPPGTTVHPGNGRTVYAGFIDPCVRLESMEAARAAAAERGAHWNARVVPQVRAQDLPALGADARKELRSLGFTTAGLYPGSGIFRGSGAVALLGDDPRSARAIAEDAGTAVAFEHGSEGDWDRATYPGALIGSIALVRQTLSDARWHAACEEVWRAHPAGNEPPVQANALAALHAAAQGRQRVWFDATDERMLLRAAAVADEFGLDAAFVGSGSEYRRLEEIRALGRPVVVTFDFPRAPSASQPWEARNASLRELQHWALAPTNLAQLERAGVPASVSTARLKSRKEFAAAARRAMEYGTTADELLAALTVHPAGALGIAAIAGTVEPGKLANLVVCEGPLYGEDARIREVWIAGVRHEVDPAPRFPYGGVYALGAMDVAGAGAAPPAGVTLPAAVVVDPQGSRVELQMPGGAGVRGGRASFDATRAGFTMPGKALGIAGKLRGTLLAGTEAMELEITTPEGARLRWRIAPSARTGDAPKRGKDGAGEGEEKLAGAAPAGGAGATPEATPPRTPDPKAVVAAIARTAPMGDFGLEQRVAPKALLIHDATIWTVAKDGILEHADLLAVDGKIVAVGRDLRAALPAGAIPADAMVVEAAGMHLTPGLIDCHSHTGIDGGVNEWTLNSSAQVRIRDAIDPDDVGWYRELAGGLTAANMLHGSANPIGGQNAVVKIRWGRPAREFPIADAPAGIKFALGENVVRRKGRYPGSRLGVEAFLRDRFAQARDLAREQARFAALPAEEKARTMPPRRDLELEALAEILAGTRLVHCHSYRQDEIAMLLRVAEEYGFRIGTLQHVLEGYKVADEIARHGAGASTFSDWWAYKMEVMDAIPWNGQLLTAAGVVTSFNSDSDELARRMNTEAAKAVRWGGLPREEAIKFVTLNPAKQLRIAHRCGSLEPGKDADLALWSADPLSVYARCEQTWVEGERLFDRATDAAMRERDARAREAILALVAAESTRPGAGGGGGDDDKEGGPPGGAGKPTENADAAFADAGGATSDARAGGLRSGASPLLSRMLQSRREALLARVRSGVDPDRADPGVCGCADALVWDAIFEETAGMGGRR